MGLLCLGVAGAALFFQLRTPEAAAPPGNTPVIAEASPIIELDRATEPLAGEDSETADSDAGESPTTYPSAGEIQVSPDEEGLPDEQQPVAEQEPATPAPEAEKVAEQESSTSERASAPAAKLSQLVVSSQRDALRIFAATGTKPDYRTFQLRNPKRLVVDLPGVRLALPRAQHEQELEHPLVKRIRAGQYRTNPPQARIVLDVTSFPEIEILPQFNGLYLVVKEL